MCIFIKIIKKIPKGEDSEDFTNTDKAKFWADPFLNMTDASQTLENEVSLKNEKWKKNQQC